MALVCRDLDLDPKRYPPRAVLNWVEQLQERAAGPRGRRQGAATISRNVRRVLRELPGPAAGANALDFDDLIMMTVQLFQAFPEVRETYRRRFRHVLVDEYQDTNHAQYVLIRELCGPGAPADADGELVGSTGPSLPATASTERRRSRPS